MARTMKQKSAAAPALERKAATGEIKAIDQAKGIVEAYVNSLNVVDSDAEIIASGAFDQSIASRLPAVAWFHDQSTIVGQVTAAKEEAGRLLATMQFDLDTPQGDYAFKMVSRGRVPEWSVGFYSLHDHPEERGGTRVRVIDRVDWAEVSPVLRGASPGTATISAKGAPAPAAATEPPSPAPESPPSDPASAAPVTAPRERAAGTALRLDPDAELLSLERAQLELLGVHIPSLKVGAAISAANKQRLQAAHDLMVELGAACTPPDAAS